MTEESLPRSSSRRPRIRAGKGLIRRSGSDYLAYALIDAILDGYYPVLEQGRALRMNFEYLPELHYRWAYPASLGVMAAVVIGMLGYFRRRGWLGATEEVGEEY